MAGKRHRRPREAFTGDLPVLAAGDRVWCRDALGRGWVKRVALGGPRYDDDSAYLLCWLSVPTASIDDYREHGPDAPSVNWPASDVQLADRPVPGAMWLTR
ncbi:hypothetical protein [Actinomadura nitritigenes]|uniref:hypothetical protein n=1 Tax=Actinomadura nitritigenes TaxID=134602 RepID=UPI003D8F579A